MADIRINALATTAASTASDDFIAIDGSANGTRKLDAYSPTFGGNLTVSGTGTTGGNLRVRNALGYATGIHTGTTSDSTQQLLLSSNAAYNHAYISKGSTTLGIGFSSDNGSFVADDSITITAATKLVTLTGNLTVSGTGTSTFAGNLGLGVTPSSWGSGWNVLQPKGGSIGSNGAGSFYIQNNAYYDGSDWRYVASSEATRYAMLNSEHYWYNANTGTAGNVITFTQAMTLKASGNLLIGTTTDGGQKLQVSGTAAFSGAVTATGGVTTAALTAPVNTLAFNLNAGQSLTFSNTGPGSGGKVIANQDLAFGANTSGSLYLLAGNSTALTIDSSQNATFAGTVKIANTAQIKGVYTTTTTFDFGTIANNDASSVCTLTMTGVSSSDSIIVSPTDGDNFPQFCTVSAVPSGNSVSVRLYNGSGSSRTVGSRTIRVTAIKF